MKNYLWKILILSVVFVVAFAVCCSLMFTNDAKYEKETAYKVVSYLGERKIKVDESKVDIKKEYVFDMDLQSVTVDKTQISTNILGKEPSVLADTYTSNAGTVAFKGTDFSFKPTNIGKEIKVIYKNKEVIGKCIDITDDGRIVAETEDGILKINSGEVSVRGIYGYV